MGDLASRLRTNADNMKDLDTDYNQSEPLLREAADEIERMQAVIRNLLYCYWGEGDGAPPPAAVQRAIELSGYLPDSKTV